MATEPKLELAPNLRSDARELVEAVKDLHEPTPVKLDDTHDVLVIPKGMTVFDTKPLRDARLERPERRRGTARHTTLDSFIRHVQRFEDVNTAVFAVDDPKAPRLVAVFDYHERGAGGAARFGEHRAEYAFPLSDAWKAWTSIGPLTQAELAAWLERRIGDVMEPSSAGESIANLAARWHVELAGPSGLILLARGISIKADVRVTNAINLSTGEAKLSFEETHQRGDGGSLTVPGGFAIAIPVFRSGVSYQIAVRLRYRRTADSIAWVMEPHRIDSIFEDAFGEACARVDAEILGDLFFGTPES